MAKTKVVRGLCTVPGCSRPHKGRGYCSIHYQQWMRGVPITAEIRTRDRTVYERCKEVDCPEPVKAKGFCVKHYAHFLRHGHTRYHDRKRPPKICSRADCGGHSYALGLCHRHYIRERLAIARFGLTLADIDAMLAAQGGVCLVCQKPPHRVDARTQKLQEICVDHDHKTGKVRGLLCDHCNRALGLFGEDPAVLRRAAEFLERQPTESLST